MFRMVDKIIQTSSVVKKSAAAAATIQDEKVDSDIFEGCMNIIVHSGGNR